MSLDPTTQANYTQVASEHIHFEWTLDFAAQNIAGSATHTLAVKEDGVREVVFDTAALDIEKVEVDGQAAKYELGEKHVVMGSALRIPLSSVAKAGSTLKITIFYKTTEGCTALQWLDKDQTQGKKHPYLFSQCQPIYARSLTPCQDTPSIKTTYSAKVASVLPTLLSAVRVSPPATGPAHAGKEIGKDVVVYEYDQPVPIPSYLIAIAAGNVVYRPFPAVAGKTWTSGIWAEPEMIEECYWEFSEDTGRFLAKEEEIVPPYRFKVYDLLVLPPSFPYGGMENACLSFLTPTLLAGDRSLVDVVVHELTHSWFGNGVTHAHATHFWLNEGWTTYMERLLLEKLHGPAERGFSYLMGAKALHDALKLYDAQPRYQRLVIDFTPGEDPDDAYSRVPYDKGANFLLHIERTLGGLDVFLPYVHDYVSTYQGKSITTEQWKDHLYAFFQKTNPEKVKALDTIDWQAWFYGEGTELPVKMEYDTSLAQQAWALAERWDKARSAEIASLDFHEADVKDFSSNQKVVFLEKLQSYAPLPAAHIARLGALYGLAATANAEIRLRFYEVALLDTSAPGARAFAHDALRWAVGADGSRVIKGRMKFCRPVFRAAGAVDRDAAVSTWKEHKTEFHPIAQKLIEKDLGL
ncbi:peptidase family M1-domain-containing protein [Phanerochaete sordida]|uniref:Peptidase family M1-domain-containing protein n=1 Tax=Phanerochaete sordida TaxID=48140 RepID=A0A9P3GDY6_9APHY|nr:peptidase family M1-domain-containing protein [Phanerochaete sordida]